MSNVIVHPLHGRPQYDNDIAALRLAQPLTLSQNVQPISLPQSGQSVPLVRLTVTGWGLTAVSWRFFNLVLLQFFLEMTSLSFYFSSRKEVMFQ